MAKTPYAAASCTGVTCSEYPIARLCWSYPGSHPSGRRSRPAASEGNSTPVGAPNPKPRSISYCSSHRSFIENFAIATLLEYWIARARVSGSSCGWVSLMLRVLPCDVSNVHFPCSPDTVAPGSTRPRERSAAAVNGFAVEPGSNAPVNTVGVASVPAAESEARARSSPVRGSRKTTSPPWALNARRAAASDCSAIPCSSASSVSTTSCPGTGSRTSRPGDWYRWPEASRRSVVSPGCPESSESSERSSPESPRPPSGPRAPMIGAASLVLG